LRFIEGLGDRGLVDFFFMESHKKNMYFFIYVGYNLCFEMIILFKKVIHTSKSNTHLKRMFGLEMWWFFLKIQYILSINHT
jgi:hypothetical protein